MIRIENLSFKYRKKQAPVIDDFNIRITAGGVYGLLGRNGAGKSTLLYLMSGLLTPTEGSVLVQGENIRHRRPSTLSQVFLVPEEFELPSVSLKQYVGATSPFYPKFSVEKMHRNLEMFELSTKLHLGSLSMGQKKKVFMSFALACNTPIILMDEPTNGLDISGKAAFRRFIASNMDEERSIIISTHQVRDINLLLDHVIVMNNHNVLLNESVSSITEHLSFVTTQNQAIIDEAVYTQPVPEGTACVLVNEDGDETEIDLESLFEMCMQQPGTVNDIFTNNNQ